LVRSDFACRCSIGWRGAGRRRAGRCRFTQPDRAVGAGKDSAERDQELAQARALPSCQPEKLTPDGANQLATLHADVGLVMAYGHILRDEFIATPRLGMLNLHTSLLPKYRGASSIQTAIASRRARNQG